MQSEKRRTVNDLVDHSPYNRSQISENSLIDGSIKSGYSHGMYSTKSQNKNVLTGMKGTLQEVAVNNEIKKKKIKKIVNKDYGLHEYSDFVKHKALKNQAKTFKKVDAIKTMNEIHRKFELESVASMSSFN